MGSIRWRILKGRKPRRPPATRSRYSGFDPMEDTERRRRRRERGAAGKVTVGSIRWRILKERPREATNRSRTRVTVGSIRWRILKDVVRKLFRIARHCYSGFDPMEDTESMACNT